MKTYERESGVIGTGIGTDTAADCAPPGDDTIATGGLLLLPLLPTLTDSERSGNLGDLLSPLAASTELEPDGEDGDADAALSPGEPDAGPLIDGRTAGEEPDRDCLGRNRAAHLWQVRVTDRVQSSLWQTD